MYKLAKLISLLCETPLHVGTGSDLGAVDLPIQREKHTGIPKVEGSGVKGCFRESFEKLEKVSFADTSINIDGNKKAVSLTFGPDAGNLHAGSLGFTDARLLLFPVKSVKGVFAWVTCPFVIERFKNDLRHCQIELDIDIPANQCCTPEGSRLFVHENKVILEEYTFAVDVTEHKGTTALAQWLSEYMLPRGDSHQYLREKLKTDLIVLADEDFADFVNLSTEVVTRTKIDAATGTVVGGALFTQEYLPAESLMYTLALTTPVFVKNKEDREPFVARDGYQEEELVMSYFTQGMPAAIQMGGNVTLGKGLMRPVAVEV